MIQILAGCSIRDILTTADMPGCPGGKWQHKPGAFGKPESVFRALRSKGVPRPGPSPAAFVHLRCASADWPRSSAPFPGGGPPIILTFRREGVSEDAMILPCRESPMTGTVACWNNGPFWAVLLPRDRRRRGRHRPSSGNPGRGSRWSPLSVCDVWHGRSRTEAQSICDLASQRVAVQRVCRMPA